MSEFMGAKYPAERTRTDQAKALSRDSGVALATVQRIITGEHGASIDTVQQIAEALQVPVYRLLIDPSERQYVIDAREIVAGRNEPLVRQMDKAQQFPPDAEPARRIKR